MTINWCAICKEPVYDNEDTASIDGYLVHLACAEEEGLEDDENFYVE